MTAAELPEDGEARLGPVALPPGRRITPDDHEPVAWVTARAVPDPGSIWSALSNLHPRTGLVPILLPDDPVEDSEDFYFFEPAGADAIGHVDAAQTLAMLWDDAHQDTSGPAPFFAAPLTLDFLGLKTAAEGGNSLADIAKAIVGAVTDPARRAELERVNQQDRANEGWPPSPGPPSPGPPSPGPPSPGPHETARETAAESAPFPGLAPPEPGRLTAAELAAAVSSLPPARIGLVPAARPADVLALTGWSAFGGYMDEPNGVWIGSVLRSWEDRFGARLLNVGPGAEIRLLVERPPRTREAAAKIAAEHSVFCDECAGQGLRDIPEITNALVDATFWTFWWD